MTARLLTSHHLKLSTAFAATAFAATAFAASLFLFGCEKAGMNEFPKDQAKTEMTEELKDYDVDSAILHLAGALTVPGAIPLSEVSFFLTADCSGERSAASVLQDFNSQGIDIEIPLDVTSRLYARTNSDSTCHFLRELSVDVSVVRVPTFSKTEPASPSRVSHDPGIFGTAFPRAAQIDFYRDSSCLLPVGSGTGQAFASTGLSLTLLAEQQTDVYGQVTDPRGQRSACTKLTSYVHTTALAGQPQFLRTDPISPNNTSATPLVIGVVASDVTTVTLYSDTACQRQIGSGTRDAFISTGIEASVTAGGSTRVYAKTVTQDGKPSTCVYLTAYEHDTTVPGIPTYGRTTPVSPTRLSPFPKVIGTLPADATSIRLYTASTCIPSQLVGSGLKSSYESVGVTASLTPNSTSTIYATSVDGAGNTSACTYLTNYRHNTIPPQAPVFDTSIPTSPTNQSTNPLLFGAPAEGTVELRFFSEETCTTLIGSGSADSFVNSGIAVTVTANTLTSIYTTPIDQEGNIGDCAFLTEFDHSDTPAPPPAFTLSLPVTPNRTSTRPLIIGSAPSTVTSVELFSDASCLTSLGSGTKIGFSTAGLQIDVPANTRTPIYGKSTDQYGNNSPCAHLVDYIHTTLAPPSPTFSAVSPLSPNNSSSSPTLTGTALGNPASPLPAAKVAFFDSSACISKLAEGNVAVFTSTGIPVNVPENALTNIYAKTFDAVSNSSACVHMTDYVHDALKPARPLFMSALPASPSYTATTTIKGTFGASSDFMARTSVSLFSDSNCSSMLASGSPSTFENTGIAVTVPANVTTPLYGASQNELGTWSDCSALTSFRHSDLAPVNFAISNNANGSVSLTWQPDMVASPAATYIVKRSRKAGGPYTLIQTGLTSSSFIDKAVDQGATYFYRIQATNSTGYSQESVEKNTTVAANAPAAGTTLTASPGASEITLSWSGFPENMTYQVLRSLQSGGPYSTVRSDLTSTSFVDKSLLNGTPYYYVVIGVNPSGNSSHSSEVRSAPLATPAPPVGFRLQPRLSSSLCGGSPGVHLLWTAPAYYNQFEISVHDQWGTSTRQTTTPEWADCSPDSFGNANSSYSVATTWGTGQSPPTTTLVFQNSGSTILSAYPGNNQIALSWAPPIGATSYELYRGSSPNGPFTLLGSGLTSTTYTDSSISNGNSAYYWVQSMNGSVVVGWPSLILGGTATAAPAAPSNLLLTVAASSYQPVLNWTAPAHYNRFVIYMATNAGGPYSILGYSNTNTFTDSSPSIGVTYYKVAAQWGSSLTTETNVVSFRRAVVNGVTLTRNTSDLSLSWTANASAQDYEILRSTSMATSTFTAIGTTATTSYVDTSIIPGQGYYYAIVPRFADGSRGQMSSLVSGINLGATSPSGLTATSISSNSVTVNWLGPTSVTQYKLKRALALAGPYTVISTATSATATYAFTGLSSRTTYYFVITAVIGGVDYDSTPLAVSTLTAPSAPSAVIGNGVIDVTWPSATGATSYGLQRSVDKISATTLHSSLASPGFSDSSVVNGTLYFYRVIVNYASGSITSPWSEGYTPGITPLVPSGLLVSENITGTSVKISWNPVIGANKYAIYQDSSLAGSYATLVGYFNGASDNEITGLTPDVPVYFKVSAITSNIETAKSSALGVTPQTPPAAPTVAYGSLTQVNVSWSAISGAATYRVDRSDDGTNFITIGSTASTTLNDSTVNSQLAYSYRYLPLGPAGEIMAISDISASIATGVGPSQPLGVTATAVTTTQIDVAWAPVTLATSYEISRSTTSGSGYVAVTTVPSPTTSWSDTTASAGNTYYYIITAANAAGVKSISSTEVSASTTLGPTGLVASEAGSSLELSWNAVGGATNYQVLRSESASDPFGLIGTSASTSATDSSALPGHTYFYRVKAVFANGTASPDSNTTSITKSGYLDLVVPIEMFDRPLSSSMGAAVTFVRSETRLEYAAYDGLSSISVEAVARNYEANPQSLEIVDEMGSTLATLTIPGNTFEDLRISATLPLPAGDVIYSLKLPQTSADDTLTLLSARLLVRQTDATRTKIYFPLFSNAEGAGHDDLNTATFSTSSTTYLSPTYSMGYVRDTSHLETLYEYNAWELDVITAKTGSADGFVSLWNESSGAAVTVSQTEVRTTALAHSYAQIDEGQTNFTTTNEGQTFTLAAKCRQNCSSGAIQVYKAGLWVRLEQLKKAQVIYRVAPTTLNLMSASDLSNGRMKIDSAFFTNPVSFLTAKMNTAMLGSATLSLSSTGTSDQGTSGLGTVSGSQISFPSNANGTRLNSSPFTVTSGDRHLVSVQPTGSVELIGVDLIVNVGP